MPVTARIAVSAAVSLSLALIVAVTAADRSQTPTDAPIERAPNHWKILLGRDSRPTQTLYVTFEPRPEGDGYTGTLSNPARGVVERPITDIYYGEIAFKLGGDPGSGTPAAEYRATLLADGTRAVGSSRIGDQSAPLRMERVTASEVADAVVEGFDAWRRYALEQSGQIIAALELSPTSVVADVGAGRGEWAVTLAERLGPEAHVFATEIDPGLLDDTRQLMAGVGVRNVTPVLGGSAHTGLPDECCDAILLRLVYHEMREPESMLAGLLRALRPGGTIAVIENPGDGEHGTDPDRIVADFTAAGFDVLRRVEGWSVDRQYCLLFTRPR